MLPCSLGEYANAHNVKEQWIDLDKEVTGIGISGLNPRLPLSLSLSFLSVHDMPPMLTPRNSGVHVHKYKMQNMAMSGEETRAIPSHISPRASTERMRLVGEVVKIPAMLGSWGFSSRTKIQRHKDR